MRLAVATKIFLAFTAMMVTFGAVMAFDVYQIRALQAEVETIHGGFLPLTLTLGDVKSDLRTYNVLLGEKEWPVLRQTLQATQGHYDFPAQVGIKLARIERRVLVLLLDASGEREKAFLTRIRAELQEARKLNDAFAEESDKFVRLVISEKYEEAREVQVQLRRMARRLESQIRASRHLVREEVDSALLKAQEGERRSLEAAAALSLVAVLISAGIMLMMHFTIRPLRLVTEGARRIGSGDYRPIAKVAGQDEIATLAREFNKMVDRLSNRDATLQMQARELTETNARIVELRDFYEDILNSVDTSILAVSSEGVVETANLSAIDLFGSGSLRGVGLEELELLQGLPEVLHQVKTVADKGRGVQHEALSIQKKGQPRRLDIDLLPLQVRRAGEVRDKGALVVLDDVTERVKTEEALIKNERLAAVGEMAAKVTHELRNPLSTVLLNAELLGDELYDHGVPDESETRETLQAIIAEVERLTSLTEDYLRFARLPAPHPVPGDFNELVESVLDFQRDELELSGVDLVTELEPELPAVSMDANQLRRAMINLIRNAREAVDGTEAPSVLVRTWTEDSRVCLEVRDNGCGIPADHLEQIFDPFFSTKSQGTGLGLPLTHQIVEEHHGSMVCTSSFEAGTSFVLRFPLA